MRVHLSLYQSGVCIAIGFLTCWGLIPVIRRLATRHELAGRGGDFHHTHQAQVSRWGGLALVVAFLCVALAAATMIPSGHLLANVNQNYNAFHIVGDASGPVFLFGQGAGMMPTASAVFSDIIDCARDVINQTNSRGPLRSINEGTMTPIKLVPMDNIETKYFFRFAALDRPGVLSKIAGILGKHNISIAACIQKARGKKGAVPIVMTTYKAREKDVRKALQKIDKLDVVQDKTILIRVEDDLN